MKLRKKFKNAFTVVELIYVIFVLAISCIAIGGLYMLFHFIAKFW